MKLSPSTIAANLSAAAAAEAEAAANSNNSTTSSSTINQSNQNSTTHNINTTSTTSTSANITLSSLHGASNATMNQQQQANSQQQQQQQQQQSSYANKLSPKDSQVVAAILKEMGIVSYEPRVLPQLVEFAYRYVSRVLEDAQLFSSYAKKKVIDTDDASLAIQMQIDRSFVGPPSRDILLEISRNKNTQPLPPIKSHNGMRLPADRYSLVAPNFRLVSKNKQIGQTKPTVRSVTSLLSGNSSFMNSKLSLATSTTINSATNKTTNVGGVQTLSNNNNDVYGSKRKLEET